MISPLPKGDPLQFARTRRQETASLRVKECWSDGVHSHAPEQSTHLFLQTPTPAPMPLGTITAGVMMWGGPPKLKSLPTRPFPSVPSQTSPKKEKPAPVFDSRSSSHGRKLKPSHTSRRTPQAAR
jgi:hypothetical protein